MSSLNPTQQPSLFADAPRQAAESVKRSIGATVIRFDGSNCTAADSLRLTGQILRVFHLMKDARWRTLDEIAGATKGSPGFGLRATEKSPETSLWWPRSKQTISR